MCGGLEQANTIVAYPVGGERERVNPPATLQVGESLSWATGACDCREASLLLLPTELELGGSGSKESIA